MIDAGVTVLDAALYTHAHADHIHGIDDLRGYFLQMRRRVPVYADQPTLDRLRTAFGYCFATPPGSSYPPILEARSYWSRQSRSHHGRGGAITFLPLPQIHGDILSLGFRVGGIAYCPDVSDIRPRRRRECMVSTFL